MFLISIGFSSTDDSLCECKECVKLDFFSFDVAHEFDRISLILTEEFVDGGLEVDSIITEKTVLNFLTQKMAVGHLPTRRFDFGWLVFFRSYLQWVQTSDDFHHSRQLTGFAGNPSYRV
jgi:hypothetical protein